MAAHHYLSNRELAAEILRCQQTMRVSDRLARMLMLLVSRLALRPNWRSYSFVDDMKADALCQLIKRNNEVPTLPPEKQDRRPNILKFNFSYAERTGKQPNPFSYATQIVTNSFRRYVKIEAGLSQFKDDCLIEAGQLPSHRRQVEMELARSSEPIARKPALRTKKSDCKTNSTC